MAREIQSYFYESPPHPLYHYTGIGTLLGISKRRALWASHISYMNDARELTQAQEIMGYLNLPDLAIDDSGKRSFYNSFIDWVSKLRNGRLRLFVFSLSEERSLLSQWRSYTPHGKGVSIAFSTQLVRETALRNNMLIGKCIYTLPEQCELVESLLEKLWSEFSWLGLAEDSASAFFNTKMSAIVQVLALIKHEAFAEEREWRLVSGMFVNPDSILYREASGAGLLTPYIELQLGDAHDLFDLVILGPTPHEEIAEDALFEFVRTHRLCHNVETSHIPYREW